MDGIILANGARYLSGISELRRGLPHGVLNKVRPDVGGTYLAINCDSDYIVVCPFIDLIDSIVRDRNNRYEVFACYGGIEYEDWERYAEGHEVHKVAVTYDSLEKLVGWIKRGYILDDYKVLIDEYHTILDDMDYREEAITSMMNVIRRFRHYTFLSATPIDEDYEISFLRRLPHYRVEWDNFSKVKPIRVKVPYLIMGLVNFIREFLDRGVELPDINGEERKVEELYIFVNSVETIKEVLDSLMLSEKDVKVCCADNKLNKKKLSRRYKIESAASPSKRINFFTKKCFQGCNMFTNNGLIVVVSDAHKKHTMVDISSTIEQIAGRLRFNDEYQNVFRNVLIHIYSTKKLEVSDKEFKEEMEERRKDASALLSIYKNINDERGRNVYIDRISGALCNDLVTAYNGRIEYNPLKEKSFIYKHKLRKIYSNSFSVAYIKESQESNKIITDKVNQIMNYDIEHEGRVSASCYIYRKRYETWLETGEEKYLKKHPEFEDYKKYLKKTEMNTLFWKKERLLKFVDAKKKGSKLQDYVYDYYYDRCPIFVTNKEMKGTIAKGIKEIGMAIAAKATLIDGCEWAKKKDVIKDGKRLVGYIITKRDETRSKKESEEG